MLEKLIAIYLSKQQALDADPRPIQQISFTANLDRAGNRTIFFIIEEPKETVSGLFTRNRNSFINTKCKLIFISIKWHNTAV